MKLFHVVLMTWLGFHALQPTTASGQTFRCLESPEGVTILEGIRPVLTYQRAVRSRLGRWPRANYVHPLYDLDGEVVTEDFPEDHGHHRGIFWAWHQVLVAGKPMGDAWLCHDFEWDVLEVRCQTNDRQAILTATSLWKSPALVDDEMEKIPFVQERLVLTVYAQRENVRCIDFDLELVALLPQVQLGGSDDIKGYGGFSPRIKLSDDFRFTARTGEVEPAQTAINAGPWIDIGNDVGGLAVLTHPSNPGFPQPWILRRARSMQNAVYPGRTPIALSQNAPWRFKYRLVLHRGVLAPRAIERLQQDYEAGAPH